LQDSQPPNCRPGKLDERAQARRNTVTTTPTYMVCRGYRPAAYQPMAQLSLTGSPTCRRLAPDFALFPYG
jgi:hypothetical protein